MSRLTILFAMACFHGIASEASPRLLPVCLHRGRSVVRRNDYTYVNGIGGYKVHTQPVSWNEGRIICEEEGGHLAIMNSVAESNAVSQIFRNAEPVVGSLEPDIVNIGFHDLYLEGQYITIHGQTLAKAGFTQWSGGQPDNAGGKENCGSIHKSGGLNDNPCDSPFGFICEQSIY